MKPLCIDLFCGLGGWAEGFLAEGYDVIGYDIERHEYGDQKYPGKLVLRDVLTIHGSELKNAAVLVASSPCQEFSYRHMPWKRARSLPPPELGIALFMASFRIQREAIEAAGRDIPLVAENVIGAQKWVGKAVWHFGSYYLWGDVPAIMPLGKPQAKVPGQDWNRSANGGKAEAWNDTAVKFAKSSKEYGGWFNDYKTEGGKCVGISRTGSKSKERKIASAIAAKIPFELASHIARTYKPRSFFAPETDRTIPQALIPLSRTEV